MAKMHTATSKQKLDNIVNSSLSCIFHKGICNTYILNLVYRMEPKCINVMFAKTSQCILGLCTFCLTYLKFKIFFAI